MSREPWTVSPPPGLAAALVSPSSFAVSPALDGEPDGGPVQLVSREPMRSALVSRD